MSIETFNHWGDQFVGFAWPMFWQSSLLVSFLFALDWILRHKLRADIRYALWLVVLVKLLLPPSLAVPTSPAWWLASWTPVKPLTTHYVVSYDNQSVPEPLPPAMPSVPVKPVLSVTAWILLMSGSASFGFLTWLVFRWLQVIQKAQTAAAAVDLAQIMDEAREIAGTESHIQVKITENSMSPALCGLFHPVILLPQSLTEKISRDQMRVVLLHELIHLRRGDVWVNCAQALIQIFYWWHPLVWLANARIRRAREEAVDDTVMVALRDDAEIYAPTLLEVAKFAFHRPLASLGLVGILESRNALRQRIERLMNLRAPRKAGLTFVSLCGICIFSAAALPMGEAPPTSPDTNSFDRQEKAADKEVEAGRLIQEAKLDYETGKFDEAEKLFKSALALTAGNQLALYYLNLVEQAVYNRATHPHLTNTQDHIAQVELAYLPPLRPGLQPMANQHTQTNLIRTGVGRKVIYSKLDRIRLDRISWPEGLPLSEALRDLEDQSKIRDSDKKGISFQFDPHVSAAPAGGTGGESADASSIHVKLRLNDVSLAEVLDAIVLVADHPIKYSVQNYGIIFSARGADSSQYETRTFKVDANTFYQGLESVSSANFGSANISSSGGSGGGGGGGGGSSGQNNGAVVAVVNASPGAGGLRSQGNGGGGGSTTASVTAGLSSGGNGGLRFVTSPQETEIVSVAAQNFFKTLGVDLTTPGKSIFFNDRAGILYVRATAQDLNIIEHVIPALNNRPPMIHIKARFIEVPEEMVKGLGANFIPTDVTNVAGFLAGPKLLHIIHALEQHSDTEELAEPEVTTISGRQTQMRATQIQTITTNFAFEEISNRPAIHPQQSLVETGPILDVVPVVLSDGYTIDLTAIPSLIEFLGYDKTTNTISVVNAAGQKISVPTIHPKFDVRQTSTHLRLWDGQTVVLGKLPQHFYDGGKEVFTEMDYFRQAKISKDRPGANDKELMVFITVNLVDQAGNRIHSDAEMPFAKASIPPQDSR